LAQVDADNGLSIESEALRNLGNLSPNARRHDVEAEISYPT
jgi:hypothetical protein